MEGAHTAATYTPEQIRKLRDRLKTEKELLRSWRRTRDRREDERLNAFARFLGPAFKDAFTPYQSPEPDQEIQRRKHILVSNPMELEVIARSRKDAAKAQQLENALEAIADALFTPKVNADECDAILGDGAAILMLERREGKALAPYANRTALARAVDPDYQDEGAAEDAADLAEPEETAIAAYSEAYRKHGDHAKAYDEVTQQAQAEEGLLWCVKVIDREVFDGFEHEDGQTFRIAMIDGKVPLNPLLKTLEGYGVRREGNRFVLTEDRKPAGQPALGSILQPADEHDLDLDAGQLVRCTRIIRPDKVCIYVEDLDVEESGSTRPDSGVVVEFDNPLAGVGTGVYIVPGDSRTRGGTLEERYKPAVLGMLVEADILNLVNTAWLTMLFEEASRPPYQQVAENQGLPPPADATRETKAQRVQDGRTPALVRGELRRAETLGVNIGEVRSLLEQQIGRYRSDDFFAGSGSAGEAGIHLARIQTAFLTQMAPIQERRAETRRRILMDLMQAVAITGEPIYCHATPRDRRPADAGGVRIEEARALTPELAKLPVDVRVTIGADSPETKYAREQAVRANVEFGLYGMTTGMELLGVKDPDAERKRMAVDAMVFDALGTPKAPGWAIQYARDRIQRRIDAYLDAQFPPPEPPGPTVPAGAPPGTPEMIPPPAAQPMSVPQGVGALPPGAARPNPPVQTQNGVPVAPGALPGVAGPV